MSTCRRASLHGLVALIALAGAGCSHKAVTSPLENQRPVVKFSRAPSRSSDLYSYTYRMYWSGFDPDGEVVGYEYAVDPPTPTTFDPDPDTTWVPTTLNQGDFKFSADDPLPPVPGEAPVAVRYHVVTLKAIDNRGLASLPAIAAFNASTVAPTVRIVSPSPYSRATQFLPPAITIVWEGSDPDGGTDKKPVFYRYKLLAGNTEITPAMWKANPDTVVRYYQPRNWAGWDSLGGDVTQLQYRTLTPESDYCFVIIAFDEAGAYTPYASGDANALNFRVKYAAAGGPLITLFNEFFSYTYANAVYLPNDPAYEVRIEVPGGVPLKFNWSAVAQTGTYVKYYRWVLDPADLNDETERSNERTDVQHWSTPNVQTRSCDLPAFNQAGDHRLYVEVGDGNDLKSLGVVHFQVVMAVFDKPLAIVDDTRLLVDRRSPGATTCIDRPLGRFPTSAELDTFLYARGGVPIRCYPPGYYSRRGIFWGYDFDTLNTRIGQANLTPKLSTLARYRHMIWIVDPEAANNTNSGSDLVDCMTAMRFMNSAGNLNALTAWVRQGGELWLAGGGAMSAATAPFNNRGNDTPYRTYSFAFGELAPGRFVYDYVHWRSEFQPVSGLLQTRRSLGRFTSAPGAYAAFPLKMEPKSLAAGDSMPAWRTTTSDFYQIVTKLEVLTKPNAIVEDVSADPNYPQMESVMDTIYVSSGGLFPANSPVMTVYHGPGGARLIATGFDLWTYQKGELFQFVDAVMQGIWGMTRNPGPIP